MDTGDIIRSEWRWVSAVTITLLLLVFSPFIIVTLLNPPNEQWQFMGALHDYQASAAHIARIQQGAEGDFLVHFRHTPEDHFSALIHPVYPVLGQLSRFTVRSPLTIYHLARILAAFFMYLALYQLAASIWVKVRTRRIFFIIASIGSGFGWIYALVTGLDTTRIVPDLMLPMIYPFYSSAVNVHYPIAIGLLALLVGVTIVIFRPGMKQNPSLDNGGVVVFLASLGSAFVAPEALIPLAIAFALSTLAQWIVKRNITIRELRWGLWVLVPALPIVVYYVITVLNNPFVAEWIRQRSGQPPMIWLLVLGLGLPLLLAVPGIWRAVRRFEPDGDRFMLLWMLAMLGCAYLPLRLNQLYLLGLMLPIAYFATRAIEDYWFNFVKRRYRRVVYVVGIIVMSLSSFLWLYLPSLPLIEGWSDVTGMVLEQNYVTVFDWLSERTDSNDVILTAPEVGAWVPVWADSRPVYGNAVDTFNAVAKEQDVLAFYQSVDPSAEICTRLVDTYHIDYIIVGSREARLGDHACVQNYTPVRIPLIGYEVYSTRALDLP
jgi:hypothetical protein